MRPTEPWWAERARRANWARVVKDAVDVHDAGAERIFLVQDNLNTHTPAALYETFPPAAAWGITAELEIRHTLNHGSWLNIAEIELSTMSGQCLGRPIGERKTLEAEVAAWEAERNALGGAVNWQFTTEDARVKLKRLYPSIQGWQCTSRLSHTI